MTDDEITQLLFMREEPVSADLAMVFAAGREDELARRTRCGVQLYQDAYVPKLLVTGGGVLARRCPEAQRMAEIALEQGVPEVDLLVEDRSSNTFENVTFSLATLEERGLLAKLGTVILVSSEWHMRRVLLTTQKFFPAGLRFVCCPTLEGCTRENWTMSGACRREVDGELLLLETFRGTGAI